MSSLDVLSEAAAYDQEVASERRSARARGRQPSSDENAEPSAGPSRRRRSERPRQEQAATPEANRGTKADPGDAIAFYCDLADISRDLEQYETPPLGALLDRVLEKGSVVVGRAYGDWGSHRDLGDDLRQRSPKAAVELVDPGVTRAGGHALRLTVDALDVCFHRPGVGTFVLVASDPSLAPLVAKLREHGRRVVVCSPADEPRLVEAADIHMPWVLQSDRDDDSDSSHDGPSRDSSGRGGSGRHRPPRRRS